MVLTDGDALPEPVLQVCKQMPLDLPCTAHMYCKTVQHEQCVQRIV
jgi:hypothetical protein